ncbi:MAG: PD-(D/E)XK nuclease family protein [Thermoplasmata archaeon]
MATEVEATQLSISAAEIEKYAYCPLNWWLYLQGVEAQGDEMAAGEQKHADLAQDLFRVLRRESRAAEWETLVMYFALGASFVAAFGVTLGQQLDLRFANIFSVLALIWLLAATFLLYRAESVTVPAERLVQERLLVVFSMGATLIALMALSLFYLLDSVVANILEVVALVWLIGASFFLFKSLVNVQGAKELRASRNLGEAPIEYVDDLGGDAPVLESRTHGLTGRPDLIVRNEGHLIPVEVKTGRVPRGPLFSHILQVAAYCLLVEETYGSRPPYGLLRYGETVHEIDYTEELEDLLLAKLDEMRAVAASGEAHRNHRRRGKCLNCSRRHACNERLA